MAVSEKTTTLKQKFELHGLYETSVSVTQPEAVAVLALLLISPPAPSVVLPWNSSIPRDSKH